MQVRCAGAVQRKTRLLAAPFRLYLRGYAVLRSSARQIPEALGLMEQAIARDPRYGPALAWAAICCTRLLFDGRSEDPAADRLKGVDFARQALEVAGDDPGILANSAQALAYLGEDIGAMMALADRALALNPPPRWREKDSNARSPVKKNPLVKRFCSTFSALPFPQGSFAIALVALAG
jgi:tetratricopeptide (TPR) repeat protein